MVRAAGMPDGQYTLGGQDVTVKGKLATLADGTIAQCDYTVMIPMTHGVDSLNVAAASAVAFYQLGLQCRDK